MGIVGEVTNLKITQKRDKIKHDHHPNTPISFKRGINTREENEMTFSLLQNRL
jgi:hypothetical protein